MAWVALLWRVASVRGARRVSALVEGGKYSEFIRCFFFMSLRMSVKDTAISCCHLALSNDDISHTAVHFFEKVTPSGPDQTSSSLL